MCVGRTEMDMELSSWKMIEQAKEELQILETHHPDRFDYLKLELKSFICLLQSQQVLLRENMFDFDSSFPLPTTSSATTQGSTCRKRKKGNQERKDRVKMMDSEPCNKKSQGAEGQDMKRRENRIDVVLERAKACLQKIQEFKGSFC